MRGSGLAGEAEEGSFGGVEAEFEGGEPLGGGLGFGTVGGELDDFLVEFDGSLPGGAGGTLRDY